MELFNFFSKDQKKVDDFFRLRRLRKFQRHGAAPKGVAAHNFLHRLMLPALILMGKLEGRKVTVLNDRRPSRKTSKPTIFASSHVGGCDIEAAFEALHAPCYLFLGDPRQVYHSVDGLFLALNGVIALETRDKTDRHIAKERGIALLKKGGNLLIYPEGAWNITGNEPVMKLFPGVAIMALECGADIVPLAQERVGKHYYVNIGKPIPYEDIKGKDTKTLTAQLRDILATLKWEIWEHCGLHSRADLPSDYREKEFYPQFAPVGGYEIQDTIAARYRDKKITAPEDAFAHLDRLIPRGENAFLFNQRLQKTG